MDTHSLTPELIAACQRGDQAACTQFFEATAPSIYRLACSVLLHEQDAEDVLQEVFTYAFRNLHQYDPARGAVSTWLYTITVSRCRNARRRKTLPMLDLAQVLRLGMEPADPQDDGPEATAIRREAHHALAQALETLSPRLREAVALRYGQGLTYREMSAVLNCPEKTAESRVRLAHDALRQAMHAADIRKLAELLPG
ncbi:MAG: RNA polymerase sigma factor [Anaerolineales bacterium]